MNLFLPHAALGGLLCTLAACQPVAPSVPQASPSLAQTRPSMAVASKSVPQPNLMGMNVDFVADYSLARPFADAMKQSRTWLKLGSDQPALLDNNGWPMEDAHLTVWHGIPRMNGVYRLTFNGQAEVGIQCCAGRLLRPTYDAGTNTTTADLIYPSADNQGLFLGFKNTKRSATSPLNSGITTVKLMRPTTEGGTQTYSPDTLFTTPYKASLKRFQVLRFMDFLATNGNDQIRWEDRTTPAQSSMFRQTPNYGWQGRGAAYEYAIQLCNEVAADCWINIPAKANDAYVQQLAALIKNQLDPQRNLYIEYANEVWNTAVGFGQSQQNHILAKAEVASGQSPLNFDGSNNDWFWAWRRVAKRGAEISLIFRQVFGDAAMMRRVRPVLMTQLGYADGPLGQAIHLMQNYYNNPARISQPKPLNYYFYGLGGSAYYAPKNPATPDTAFADFSDQEKWAKYLQFDTNYAVAFGVKHIAYEGGPSLEKDVIPDERRAIYRDDPRIRSAMVQAHDLWSANGGDLLVYFTLTGESPWGFVHDIWDAANPQKNLKLQAIDVLKTRPRAKATYGTLLPATWAASAYQVPPEWMGKQRMEKLQPGQWVSYTVRADRAETFNLQLKASAQTAKAQVEIWVDGQLQGILDIPQVGWFSGLAATKALTIPFAEGIHGILVRGKTGTINIEQIQVTRTNSSS